MNIDQAEVHIKNIIDNHIAIVDEDMLNFFKQEFAKGTYSSYENCQALALEYSLRKVGLLTTLPKLKRERYQWRHDWAYTLEILIDLKRRPLRFPNTTIGNPTKALSSVSMNQLTHYVIYTTNKENDLFIGDELKFKFEDMISVQDALKQCIMKQGRNGDSYASFPNRYRKFKD